MNAARPPESPQPADAAEPADVPAPSSTQPDAQPETRTDGPEEAREDASTAVPTMVLGALMLLLSVAVLVQAAQLPPADNKAGPATLMWVVGALLFVVGGMTIRTGRRDLGPAASRPQLPQADWWRVLALLGLLVVFALALGWVGYVVSATFLFGASAIVLGARWRLRSFAYGWCIAVLVYLVFDTGIGLSLPNGPWGF